MQFGTTIEHPKSGHEHEVFIEITYVDKEDGCIDYNIYLNTREFSKRYKKYNLEYLFDGSQEANKLANYLNDECENYIKWSKQYDFMDNLDEDPCADIRVFTCF